MTERLSLGDARPSARTIARYRAAGHWRVDTVLDSVRHWASTRPEAVAVVAGRADGTRRSVSYVELAARADRYAGALHGWGVGPGSVVSTWLPTRWELGALMLACWRVGAALSPMMPAFGPREVQRMMARVGSRVCVTVDASGGVGHAAALARMAPELPALRHQVVLGTPGPGQVGLTGEPAGAPDAAVDADDPSIVMFTSGTTGEAKAVIHSLDTMSSHWTSCWDDYGLGPATVAFTPQSLSHALGMSLYLMCLRRGATAVVLERWDPEQAVDLMRAAGATVLAAVPAFLDQLLAASPTAPPDLRHVVVGGTPPTRDTVERARRDWGIPPRNYWGMTEGAAIFTRPDDPVDGPTGYVGRPAAGMEVRLHADGPHPVGPRHPGRLGVRGPLVCLATAGRDGGRVRVVADHDDGWYDTGDLAAPDERGGYCLHGRAVDRVGGAFMIPVATVEDALREHPDIADVALIETHEQDEPIPCAVVVPVPGGAAPDLAQVRAFLLGHGMTEFYLPRRLEILPTLPRTAMGKTRKALLRDRYDTGART